MGMLESITGGKFTIVVEFTPHSKDEVKHIAKIAAGMPALNEMYSKHGIVFAGVSLAQSAGGDLSGDYPGLTAILKEEGFPESLEICPRVTVKDAEGVALRELLISYCERGFGHVLAPDGHGPTRTSTEDGCAPARADLPQLVKAANLEILRKCKTPETFASARLLHAGVAAVPSGYAGCVVLDQFVEVPSMERAEDAVKRAGRQLAMFRALGYAGAGLRTPGGFPEVQEIEKVVEAALEIGDWQALKASSALAMPREAAPCAGAGAGAAKGNPLAGSGLVQIAELIHASIPLPGAAMKFIQKMGEEGFTKPNRGLLVIEDLISSQARQGADYIDVNLDALGDPNAPELMRRFVRLVHKYGEGVPPCVDSSDVRVLQAGLEEWNRLEGKRPALVNSVPFMELGKYRPLLELRKRYAFSVICLLVGAEGPLKSTAEMVSAARGMFRAATAAGFRNNEILFDSVTLGIASDGCMDAMGNLKPSHTHNSFHAIREMRQDPAMAGVHCVLGVSNWVYGARKRRIGHIRAFIAAAQKHGLDAAIVDVGQQYGITPAPKELVGFVETFVALDGREDSMMTYSAAMQEARQANWI